MINGRIVGKKPNGDLIVRPHEDCVEEVGLMLRKRKTLVTMKQLSPDMVTPAQRKKAHALINDINNYSMNDPKLIAEMDLKYDFCDTIGYTKNPLFSLADCSKELAMLFINYLVEYCFRHDIPFDSRELHLDFDTSRKMFLSALYNRCFATQARRQDGVLHIHHVNEVGRGNRSKVDHRGRYYLILRADLHNEIHSLGYWDFCEKWHCGAIQLTDQQLVDFHLMSKKQMQERDADPDYEIKDWQLPQRK